MPRMVDNTCVNCGACESICPMGAISEQDGKRVIDEDICVDCYACEMQCPVSAIHEK